MIREQVTVEDFNRISQENEYYLWHFVKKEYVTSLEIQSYFYDKTEKYKLKISKVKRNKTTIVYLRPLTYIESDVRQKHWLLAYESGCTWHPRLS